MDVEFLDNAIFGLDEIDSEPLNEYFERAGHEGSLFVANVGLPMYVLSILTIAQLLKLVFMKITFVKKRLDGFTNLNGFQRFFLQLYYEVALYAMVEAASRPLWQSENSTVKFSHALTIIVLVCIAVLPFVILCGHMKAGQGTWGRSKFKKRCGALLDGTTVQLFDKHGRSQAHLLIPAIFFFVRRLVLTICMVWMYMVLGQIMLQMTLTLFQICLLLDRRRIDSTLGYRMEIFNEMMIVCVSYTMIIYACFPLEGVFINAIGMLNVILILLCLGVNAVVIIAVSLKSNYRWCRYRFVRKSCV